MKGILGALAKLRNELQTNKPITRFDESLAVGKDNACMEDFVEWNIALGSMAARNLINLSDPPKWFESSWLFVECYMYRRIMAAIHATYVNQQIGGRDLLCELNCINTKKYTLRIAKMYNLLMPPTS